MKRLAIITTHPIQYNAPFFRKLAESGEIDLKIFYTWARGAGDKHDPGFGQTVEWDIPLLEGYPYMFVKNISVRPGSHHYKGIICPSLIDEIKAYYPNAILIYGWHFHAHLRAMRYFKGKIPVWFRGDSTLMDYDYKTLKEVCSFFINKSQLARTRSLKDYETSGTPNLGKVEFLNHKLQITNFFIAIFSFLKFTLRKLYLTNIFRHIDKAFYVGIHNKAYFKAHGLKEEQLIHMPHAVDNEFFSLHHDSREKTARDWRKTLGIADNDFVVLFAGKFEPKKNPELLVKAIIEINEQAITTSHLQIFKFSNFQIHLIMVGNGILEQELRHLTDTKKYIHFLPFQNQTNMPVVYRLGNVFCLPSISETWGLGLNEALASGRPVIASDKVGGAPDLITDGVNGYIFQSNNQRELQGKIMLAIKLVASEFDDISIVETMKKSFSMKLNTQVLIKCLFKH